MRTVLGILSSNTQVRTQRLNTHCMLHGGLRIVLGILRLKHTGEESEAEHTLYAAWWFEDSPRYTEAQTHR